MNVKCTEIESCMLNNLNRNNFTHIGDKRGSINRERALRIGKASVQGKTGI